MKDFLKVLLVGNLLVAAVAGVLYGIHFTVANYPHTLTFAFVEGVALFLGAAWYYGRVR